MSDQLPPEENIRSTTAIVPYVVPQIINPSAESKGGTYYIITGHPKIVEMDIVDRKPESWRSYPLVFACPIKCGASNLFHPENVKRHLLRSHTIKIDLRTRTGPNDQGPPTRSRDTHCPLYCGAPDFENPYLVETHVWVSHSSKPEEQELVPMDDLEIAEMQNINDGMQLGMTASRENQPQT